MTEMQNQLPNLTYDLIFNKESLTFEIWQYNNDFNTRALLQSYSLELITQLLKENFVNALLLLGATVKQVPEVPVSGYNPRFKSTNCTSCGAEKGAYHYKDLCILRDDRVTQEDCEE